MHHSFQISFQFGVGQFAQAQDNDSTGGIGDDDLQLCPKRVGALGVVTRGVVDDVADEGHLRSKLPFETVHDRPRALALFLPIGVELDQRSLACFGNEPGGRAALPHTHQPDGVKTKRREVIPRLRRHRSHTQVLIS